MDGDPPAIRSMPPSIVAVPFLDPPHFCNSAVEYWEEPTATDNCGVVSLQGTHHPGDSFPVGTTPVWYQAYDAAGNRASDFFNITVKGDAVSRCRMDYFNKYQRWPPPVTTYKDRGPRDLTTDKDL